MESKTRDTIIVGLVGFIFIVLAGVFSSLPETEAMWKTVIPISVTFWFIVAGTVSLCVFIYYKEKFFWEDVTKLKTNEIRSYYFKLIEIFGIVFTASVIAVSLLWSFRKSSFTLQIQTLLLISFLVYFCISLFATITNTFKK